MRIFLLLLWTFTFIPQAWAAANTPAPASVVKGDFSQIKNTATGRVEKIIDAQTILLKDGKIVRLLGIDYPFVPGGDVSLPALAAKDRLGKLLPGGTEIILWQSRNSKTGRVNRMGHILAHLVIKKDERWINGTLLDDGVAWVSTDWNNPDMADQMYMLEDKARKARIGLWKDKGPYGVLTPDTAAQGDGTFRIVQGTVKRAAMSKNNLYLNFGSDMKKDFTVMIPVSLRKNLARKGVDPISLSGKEVRVRGWLREWNGPFMELETPERLEILSTVSPTGLSPPLPTEPSTISTPVPQTGQINP